MSGYLRTCRHCQRRRARTSMTRVYPEPPRFVCKDTRSCNQHAARLPACRSTEQ